MNCESPVLRTLYWICLGCVCPQVSLLGQAPAAGPGPLVTDRPDQTESTSIVPLGFVQLEAGWSWSHELDGPTAVRTHTVPALLARVGIWERLEGRLGFSGFQSVHAEGEAGSSFGSGDMELGFKYRLWGGRALLPEAAFIGRVPISTGSEGLSSERAEPSVLLAFSSALSERLTLGYNLGSVWGSVGDGAGKRTALIDLIYTVSLGVSGAQRLAVFVEVFGALGVREGGSTSHSVDGGLAYRLANNLQVDLSGGFGLNRASSDWFLGAGLAVRLPR